MLLVRTPYLHQLESVTAYLLRLSNTNGHGGVRWVLRKTQYNRLLPEGFLQKLLLSQINIQVFNQLTGQPAKQIAKIISNQLELISRENYSVYRPKLCPVCIEQFGYNPFFNEYIHQVICPIHHVVLVDTCASCRRRISWQRLYLERCDCGARYADQSLQLSEKPLLLLFVQYGLVSDDNGEFHIKDEAFWRKIWQYAQQLFRPLDAMTNDASIEFVSNETRFLALAESVVRVTNRDYANEFNENKRKLLEQTRNCLVAPEFQIPLVNNDLHISGEETKLLRYLAPYSPIPAHGNVSGNPRTEEDDLYHVSKKRLLNASRLYMSAGNKRSLNDILMAQADVTAVSQSLGIAVNDVIQLADNGWFDDLMIKHRSIPDWIFDLDQINTKVAQLYSKALSRRNDELSGLVCLNDAGSLRDFGVSLSKILDSTLLIHLEGTPQCGLSNLYIAKHSLQSALEHGLLEDRLLDLESAAEFVGTTPAIIYVLNAGGIISDGAELMTNRKTCSLTALTKFRQKFVILNAICADYTCSAKDVVSKLLKIGVRPDMRIEAKSGPVFIYQRSAVVIEKINRALTTNYGPYERKA